MPRNGTDGTFTRTDGTRTGADVFVQEASAGIDIEAANLDTEAQDMALALTASIAKDGQTTAAANLPMGGFKHTSVGDASTRTDYAKVSQAQDGAYDYCGTSGGSGDVQTITAAPAITAYVVGQKFRYKAGFTNTVTTPTLNVSGVGAGTVQKRGAALVAGDITAGNMVDVEVSATTPVFQMTSPPGVTADTEGTFTPVVKFGATTATSTIAVGNYTRSGNTVDFWITVDMSNKNGGTGALTITGLPLAAKTVTNASYACAVCAGDQMAPTGGTIVGKIDSNTTVVRIQHNPASTATAVTNFIDTDSGSTFGGGGSYLSISGSYPV